MARERERDREGEDMERGSQGKHSEGRQYLPYTELTHR